MELEYNKRSNTESKIEEVTEKLKEAKKDLDEQLERATKSDRRTLIRSKEKVDKYLDRLKSDKIRDSEIKRVQTSLNEARAEYKLLMDYVTALDNVPSTLLGNAKKGASLQFSYGRSAPPISVELVSGKGVVAQAPNGGVKVMGDPNVLKHVNVTTSNPANTFSAKSLLGKKHLVVIFWSMENKDSMRGLRSFARMAEDLAEQDVVVLAINLGDDPATVKKAVGNQLEPMLIGVDPHRKLQKELVVALAPTTVLVAKDGTARLVVIGASNKADTFISDYVEMINEYEGDKEEKGDK
jgi:hypothetical protein